MDLKQYLEIPPWEWPPESGRLFLKVLTDGSAKQADRNRAAELAGDTTVIDDDLTNALLAIIGDESEPAMLRSTSAISLGPVLELADVGDLADDLDDVPISEATFARVKEKLRKLYADGNVPKEVRRRILEASVRASASWHTEAISKAYASGEPEWILTAVFAMNYVQGFEKEILEALNNADEQTRCHAITAAGGWELAVAWPQVQPLLQVSNTPKPLLLAAIEAVSGICPGEAAMILTRLAGSDDEEIREAVEEAVMMAGPMSDEDFEEDADEKKEWVN